MGSRAHGCDAEWQEHKARIAQTQENSGFLCDVALQLLYGMCQSAPLQ